MAKELRALSVGLLVVLLPTAPAAEEPGDLCSPDDEESVTCWSATPEAAKGPPACVTVDAGVPPPPVIEIGSARVQLRPARIRPGDFFEITVVGPNLRSAAGSFGGAPVPMFPDGPDRFRGYGAVPLDFPAAPTLVHVAVVNMEMTAKSGSLPLQLVEREVIKKAITVDSRFTSPSAAQLTQMRGDAKALRDCYRVDYGPTLFTGNFIDPIGHERGSRFGERRVFNGRTKSRHWGLDIDGDLGEPVKAANDGVVALARPCFMSGNTVIISHGAALFTGYFHFSKFAVKTGQTVRKGEIVGYAGSTGRATGPHLHFAARLGDALIDPEALLDFDFAATAPAPTEPPPDASMPDASLGEADASRESAVP